MKAKITASEEPCEVVLGHFSWGSQLCMRPTKFVTHDELGAERRVCLMHIEMQRKAENKAGGSQI